VTQNDLPVRKSARYSKRSNERASAITWQWHAFGLHRHRQLRITCVLCFVLIFFHALVPLCFLTLSTG